MTTDRHNTRDRKASGHSSKKPKTVHATEELKGKSKATTPLQDSEPEDNSEEERTEDEESRTEEGEDEEKESPPVSAAEQDEEMEDDTQPTPPVELTPKFSKPTPTLVPIPGSRTSGDMNPPKIRKSRGTQDSIHAMTTPTRTPSASSSRPPPLAKMELCPPIQGPGVTGLMNLEERLAAFQKKKEAIAKAKPWVFEPKVGKTWPKGNLYDRAGPYRHVKQQEALEGHLGKPGVVWAAGFGIQIQPSKTELVKEAAEAFLAEKHPGLSDPTVLQLTTVGCWSLLQMPSREMATALAAQQVILHKPCQTGLFFFPNLGYPQPIQNIFVNLARPELALLRSLFQEDYPKALLSVRTAVSRFFGLEVNRVEETPLFNLKEKDKIGLRVYLADPANYENLGNITDEDMNAIVEWGEAWGTSKSIMHVSGRYKSTNREDPLILVNMMHPCGYCHVNDHDTYNCPWPNKKWLEDGRELLITLKGREHEA